MILKIQKQNRIPLECLIFEVAMICVLSYALLEHVSIPIPAFSAVKMPMLSLGGFCILLHSLPLLRTIKKKKYFYVFFVLLVFFFALVLTMLFCKAPIRGATHKRSTMRLILYLAELFLLMLWTAESGRSQHVLSFLFYYVLIATIVTDFLLFSRLVVFRLGRTEHYLVGTKFTVAYYHINLLTLWFMQNRHKFGHDKKAKRIVAVGIPFVMFVSFRVDCITGVLGCLIMLIMFLGLNTSLYKKIVKLQSPLLLLSTLAASILFPFLSETILKIPVVTNIIQTVLGRSTTLTGRVDIYSSFINNMQGHWLWGYGYGNANVVSMKLFGYANAQNGLLQWILQIGIPASVLLILLMVMVFYRLRYSSNLMRSMPLIILIYLYILLGMVETTISMSFLLWLALLFMLSVERSVPVRIEG